MNSAGSKVANWDSTGDHLYNTQSSVGDIQHRCIDYLQEIICNFNDGLHCTNPPILTQIVNGLDQTDIDDYYTDDETDSYMTMDTHTRVGDDFF